MRAKIILAVIVLTLSEPIGIALAQQGPPSELPFNYVQTYAGWGPATYYGQTVTVHYEGMNRLKWDPQNHHFNLKIQGTATVYAGESVVGDPIDQKPFINTEDWVDEGNTWKWPGRWYNCEVQDANYYWCIPEVYYYYITKRGDTWSWGWRVFSIPQEVMSDSFTCTD